MSRFCVIFNPVAKGDKARRFRQNLNTLAQGCEFKPTTGPGSARKLATEAVRQGFDLVGAAGGDGTVNEVVNGIADAKDGLQATTLGIIPLGTANVFARELNIPLQVHTAWSLLHAGKTARVDIVRVDHSKDGLPTRRWFIQVGGAGLDARAVELVDWVWKKRVGFLAYITAGLRALRESQPPIAVRAGDTVCHGQVVLLGNGRLYGGPFELFPQADLQDGRLDFRVLRRADWRTACAALRGMVTRRFHSLNDVICSSAATLDLTADQRVPLQLDGEFVGELPATFEVEHQALRVVVP